MSCQQIKTVRLSGDTDNPALLHYQKAPLFRMKSTIILGVVYASKRGWELLPRFDYKILIFVVRNSQKSCPATMVAAYFISVVNRNFIKASMPWTEELAIYSMTYLALLGTEVGLRDGTQVAVTAVTEKLSGIVKKIVSVIEQIVLEVFSIAMFAAGTSLVLKQMETGQSTPVLKIPMAALYFSLVLTFGLVIIVQGVVLVEKILDLRNKEEEVTS